MWNPLSWVMEAAAIMAIALANGGVSSLSLSLLIAYFCPCSPFVADISASILFLFCLDNGRDSIISVAIYYRNVCF